LPVRLIDWAEGANSASANGQWRSSWCFLFALDPTCPIEPVRLTGHCRPPPKRAVRPALRDWSSGRIGRLIAYGAVLLLGVFPGAVFGWGVTGHAVIAYIADQYLQPAVRIEVHRLLASDTSGLADPDDIGDQAVWADRYRDSRGRSARYRRTRHWHFVDLDLHAPDLTAACHGRVPLHEGQNPASGPAQACVVDKILQFRDALAHAGQPDRIRLRALQFLLHLVGDVHQPLHASTDGDAGGNDRRVSLPGLRTGSLHHYWDTEFVERLSDRYAEQHVEQRADGLAGRPSGATVRAGARREARSTDARAIADQLLVRIRQADIVEWSIRDPEAWAWEAYRIAKKDAYGRLRKPDRRGIHRLTKNYAGHADAAVTLQLSRAGIRLATLLNEALSEQGRRDPLPTSQSASAARTSAVFRTCPSFGKMYLTEAS
jgi:hypothetical protein